MWDRKCISTLDCKVTEDCGQSLVGDYDYLKLVLSEFRFAQHTIHLL
jgi:hypothetical protein